MLWNNEFFKHKEDVMKFTKKLGRALGVIVNGNYMNNFFEVKRRRSSYSIPKREIELNISVHIDRWSKFIFNNVQFWGGMFTAAVWHHHTEINTKNDFHILKHFRQGMVFHQHLVHNQFGYIAISDLTFEYFSKKDTFLCKSVFKVSWILKNS